MNESISNEVGAALLVGKATLDPPSAHLDDDAEFPYVVFALWPESGLNVAHPWRSGPRLLGTLDSLDDNVR